MIPIHKHGGARAGSGRPKKSGGETKPKPVVNTYEKVRSKLREVDISSIITEGKTPLEVMLEAMRFFRSQAAKAQAEPQPNRQVVKENLALAAAIAKDAAPYLHQKLSVAETDMNGNRPGKKEQREEDARTAPLGTDWGDIIKPKAPAN